jgi:ZIP family zinc transporter
MTRATAAPALIVACTLAGVWAAQRIRGDRLPMAFASTALISVLVSDVLPTTLLQARDQDWPPAVAGSVAIAGAGAGFLLMRHAGRGCLCDPGRVTGPGSALALSTHRLLEGVAVTLVGSPGVLAAVAVHAGSEGVALGGLLRRSRHALWGYVAVACVSPFAGALLAAHLAPPAWTGPLVLAVIAGVLLRVAWVAATAAWQTTADQPNPAPRKVTADAGHSPTHRTGAARDA